ncbi:MAG: hypothetical protein SFX72_19360 [Isosphaeraceae bacterium]|nr:hypothetical protein [Isosphaeraceae bacterium]
MKRFFAAVFLLAALGVLLKLAVKPEVVARNGGGVVEVPPVVAVDEEASHGRDLVAKYPDASELVERVYDAYRLNAIAIERTDGLRGLELLDKLGIEALYLYDKHPSDFRRLRDTLNDAAAADVLLHWREYFADKRNDHNDRRVLIAEIGRLKSEARKIAAVRPNLLPLLMAEPDGLIQLVRKWGGDESILTDVLAVLGFISLERGNVDLRSAIRTLDYHGLTALDAFRAQGLDGFALVGLYGEVLELRGGSLDLSEALILLRVNSDYVDELLRSHRPEIVAQHLQHVVGAGLVKQVGGSTQALRLFVEHGSKGEEALRRAGPDAADVVYGDYADPTLRNQAVAALAEHGTAALAMLEKYAVDSDFREILRTHGPAIIPPIAQSDTSPETLALLKSKSNLSWKEWLAKGVLAASSETGQATIRLIKSDGLDRVAQLGSTSIEYYQFLPLYDLVHLGTVLSRGHAPTGGEMTWALLDGCFVIADVLSLAAAQPEGVAAAEAVRSELKSAAKTAVRAVGADAVEESIESLARRTGETAGKQLSRWWVVRAAGGTYEVLKRTPEAFEKLGFDQIAGIGRALSAKAGLHLSTWTPMRFLRDGLEVVKQVPRERGLRYLGLQLSQAGVGLVGVQKMEEYLQSRRPTPVQE